LQHGSLLRETISLQRLKQRGNSRPASDSKRGAMEKGSGRLINPMA
jgi:hypothetical protein